MIDSHRRPRAGAGVRYLIVANQTLGGRDLDVAIEQRIRLGEATFVVVVPMIEVAHEASNWVAPEFYIPPTPLPEIEDAVQEARARSEHRLQAIVTRIRELGGEAEGEVGSGDPMEAVEVVLERDTFDEIIVSTLPARLSRWLRIDLPSRITRSCAIPVVTVTAAE